MEAFIVSARKYRPQHFNTVVGQSHITNTLKNAIAHKQLAQAYLFCGPRGVGKTTCARIFAKTINCFSITPEGEACDKCESCQSFNTGGSLNVYELDAASNNSVEDIRNLVDQVRFAPQLGEYKVYIIDEVHMLSAAAFNAFLKTLEEPPKHAKFILATTEKHKIIPTILSRCQVFNFNRIKNEDISNHLAHIAKTENVSFEPEALHVIAQKADGGLRDACSIFDQMVAFTGNHLTYKAIVENLHVLDFDYYFKITDFLLSQKLPEIMVTFDDILKKGFDSHNFIIGLGEHLRNVMVSRDPQTIQLLEISDNLKPKYAEQSGRCPLPFLLKCLALISKTDVNYKSAKNPRLLVEMTLMQMAYINTAQNMDAEKKNELDAVFETKNSGNQTSAVAPNVQQTITNPNEKNIKTTDKPLVPFSELKIKAQFSLNEATKMKSVQVATITTEAEKPLFENKAFSFEDLQKKIQAFADTKNSAGNRQLFATLSTAKIELNDTNLITLNIHNEAQKEILMNVKQDFLDYLRNELSNNTIGMDIRIEQIQNSTSKAYKPADKFKYLAEKNPSLLELKKRFGLELDY